MIAIRGVQGYFIHEESYYSLKWLLLGEWLNQGFRMYSQTFDYTGPLAVLVYKYLNLIFGRTAFMHYGFSSLVIILQAGIFNQLLLKNKAYEENSYLPAFLYVILMVSIPDFRALSPQLLSLTFILLALQNVFRRIDNQATDELFLNSGIYVGVATMIYVPSIIFFIVFLVAMILFSSAVARRLMLYLFGFLLSFSLCALYFYWRGDLWVFLDSYLIQNLTLDGRSKLAFMEGVILVAGFLFIFLLSVFKTWKSARLTNFQQKMQQVIWLMFFGGLFTGLLSNEKSLHEVVFFVPLIAYFWTHYFLLLEKRIFKFLMPGLMILGLLGYSCFSYSQLVQPLQVKKVSDAHQKVMVLGENLSYYQSKKIYTPCFNKHLTNQAFKGLSYYTPASELYLLFRKTDPQTVIDEIGMMPQIFQRFPAIESAYEEFDSHRYRKN